MKTKTKRGSALLLTTILLFVVLSLVVSLSYVTVMEQQMSSKTKSSVGSFFNADSGVEWALNKIASSSGGRIRDVFAISGDGSTAPFSGAGYRVYLLDSEGKVIIDNPIAAVNLDDDISEVKAVRSVGTQTAGDPTQRAIEAAVGADTICSGVPTEISAIQPSTPSVTFEQAAKACRGMGGCWHLPSFDELGIFVNQANPDNWVWTTTSAGANGYIMLMRAHSGQTRWEYPDTLFQYMCVR